MSSICQPDLTKGERPADVIGAAVKVMRIATGEEPEDYRREDTKDRAAKALGKEGRGSSSGEDDARTTYGDSEEGGGIEVG